MSAQTKDEEKLEGNKEQILSIVPNDIWSAFSHSCEYITETIIAQGVDVCSSKDFLKQGHGGAIRRGHNSRKRRCIVIYLSKIDDCDIRQVIDGR